MYKIRQLFKSAFIHNTGWMIAERVYQLLVSLFVGLLTARYLGPSNYGIINYAAAFISFATPICNLGLEGILVKRFVNEPDNDNLIIGTAMVMEFLISIVSSAVIIILVAISNGFDRTKILVTMLESFSLLFKSVEPIEFWYQSKIKSKNTSIVKVIAYTIMSAYRIYLLASNKSVEWFAFSTSLDMLVIACLYIPMYRFQRKKRFIVNLIYGKALLSESYHFILSGLMAVIYSQMDRIMINSMFGDVEVGLYSASYTICNLWFMIPTALIASARPIIMQAKSINENLYLKRLKELYASIFWLGVFVGLFCTIFSHQIINLLYGSDYVLAANTLSIGIWYGIFAELGVARGVWILCEKKNKYAKYFLAWGVLANLILNWTLIPIFGIDGAALATLITQVVTCVIAPLLYKETRIHTSILLDAISFGWLRN